MSDVFHELKFIVRFFADDTYLYSIHCGKDILDEIVSSAKKDGKSVKIVAYKDSESEV